MQEEVSYVITLYVEKISFNDTCLGGNLHISLTQPGYFSITHAEGALKTVWWHDSTDLHQLLAKIMGL